MGDVVVDTSAIIAVIKQEPGVERVEAMLEGARLSSLNAAELSTWLALRGMPANAVAETLDDFGLVIEGFDRSRAIAAGMLVTWTRSRGLSLADRACLALAVELGFPVFTADRAWAGLDVGAEVRLIR